MRRTPLLLGLLVCLQSAVAAAQDDSECTGACARGEQAVHDAQAHAEGGRHALAAQRFLDAYDAMREAEMRTAPLVLWNAGDQLSQVPGREREAIDVIRRFLRESTPLADEMAAVRDWRSDALGRIDELEARAPQPDEPSEQLDEPSEGPVEQAPSPETTTHISPIGPVVLGVGGAVLIAGLITGGISLGLDADFRDACDDLSMCPTALRPQYDEMRAVSTAADVLMVAGGATALLGLILTLTVTEDDEAPEVAASCTDTGCYAAARGRF